MYWDDTPSKIDNILQQEDVSLEQILEEEYVLQECIGNNESLIKFLTKEESMVKMLQIMTTEPIDSNDVMINYKHADTICEIFTHDKNVFSNLIATNPKYLNILWSFLGAQQNQCNSNNNDNSTTDDGVDGKNLSSENQLQSKENQSINQSLSESEEIKKRNQSSESIDNECSENKVEKDININIDDLEERKKDQQTEENKTKNVENIEGNSSNSDINENVKNFAVKPLNPLLASFFTKVFLYIFTHDNEPVLEYLLSCLYPNDLVTMILKHISTSAIMDFIYKTWEHSNVVDKVSDARFDNLLLENNFVEKLIDVFEHPELESEQQNAANLIADMVRVKREVYLPTPEQEKMLPKFEFESEKTVRALLNKMFKCKTKNSIVNGLKIIQVLLQYNLHVQTMIHQQEAQLSSMARKSITTNPDQADVDLESMPKILLQQQHQYQASSEQNSNMVAYETLVNSKIETKFMQPQLITPEGVQGEHLSRSVKNVSKAICERLEDFVELLSDDCIPLQPIKSTVGLIEKPLGLIRLEIIHLFVALFATSNIDIMHKCLSLNVLQILTDLFFKYSLNNQLHKYYEQIIYYIFQNYNNFKFIYDKHQANAEIKLVKEGQNQEQGQECQHMNEEKEQAKNDKNVEKVSHFINLFEVSKLLVKQILKDCRLVEKILENYSKETVPVKSFEMVSNKSESMTTSTANVSSTSNEKENEQNQSENKEEKEKCEDVEMVEESDESSKTVEKRKPTEPAEENSIKAKNPKQLVSRPGYMGHLYLIAKILQKHCDKQLLIECDLKELSPKWQEFCNETLKKLNRLIETELIPETKSSLLMNSLGETNKDEEAFFAYHTESLAGTNLPENTNKLLPDAIGQNPLGNINEQLKLNEINASDIVMEKFRKYLNNVDNVKNYGPDMVAKNFEFTTRIMDENFNESRKSNKELVKKKDDFEENQKEEEEEEGEIDSDEDEFFADDSDRLANANKLSSSFLNNLVKDDFATFDSKDPVFKMADDPLADFEDYFTNIDAFNATSTSQINISGSEGTVLMGDQSPWSSVPADAQQSGSNLLVNDEDWANFSSEDPFIFDTPQQVLNSFDSIDNEKTLSGKLDPLNTDDDRANQQSLEHNIHPVLDIAANSVNENDDDVFISGDNDTLEKPNTGQDHMESTKE